jgi:hypothetical protein
MGGRHIALVQGALTRHAIDHKRRSMDTMDRFPIPGHHRSTRAHAAGRLLAIVLGAFALCAIGPATAAAECVVDQSNIAPPTTNLAAVFSTQQFGQTFTVGRDGVLCAVAMYVDKRNSPTADLVAEVQGVSGGLPDGTVHATASLSAGSVIDGLNVFDVSAAGLVVSVGDVFAIVLKSTAVPGTDYLAREVPGNLYADGVAVLNSTGSWTTFGTPAAGFDAIFQTAVDSDVHEPAAQITATIALVESFNLPQGTSNSLVVKLEAAGELLSENDLGGSCAKLTDFLAAVRAQRGKHIPATQADDLSAGATQIQAALGCS